MDAKTVVFLLGGPTKVAKLCGIKHPQAVSMWVSRGEIPHARLMYLRAVRPDIFAAEKVGCGETANSRMKKTA